MNRRTVLSRFPGAAAILASLACMVPALAADAKSANGDIEILSVWSHDYESSRLVPEDNPFAGGEVESQAGN